MKVKARASMLRSSAHKVRLVIDLIRGKSVKEAETILNNTNRKGARLVLKVLNSSVANAVNNHNLDKEKLMVSEAFVDEGKVLKRHHMGSRGHVDKNFHRTCHITVVVAEKN